MPGFKAGTQSVTKNDITISLFENGERASLSGPRFGDFIDEGVRAICTAHGRAVQIGA